MSRNIYALLVGINDYSPNVGKLSGCLNDVDHFHGYLADNFDRGRLHIEVLKDADATRPNIIKQFRSHLGKANKDDVVVFQYCGHGARWKSAKPFEQFYPDGKDEGLVCYDSRGAGGFDLADKELAALIAELARNEPHIAVILDCCHSGSATRSADDFTQGKCRQTHEVMEERPLESYLDGYYSGLLKRGESLEIPASRHILLAACQRIQKAWEAKDHSGVFTSTLIEALGKSGPDISYADLFVRCRAMVHKRADNQDPQFETYRGFNAYIGFLGKHASQAARRYNVYFANNAWRVDCGALHGLPSDPDKNVELVLYPETDRTKMAGHAATTQVGPQKSELKLLDMEGNTSTRYQAEITSLPVAPLAIYLDGDAKGTEALQKFLDASEDRSQGIAFINEPEGARYTLSAENNTYLLKLRETGKLIQGAKGYTKEAADYMFAILKRVSAWERAVVLQNLSTKMDPDNVAFKFCEVLDDDQQHEYPGTEITIDITKKMDDWRVVRGMLKANNQTQQTLNLLVLYFSENYGFRTVYNEPVDPTNSDFTLLLGGDGINEFALGESQGDQAIHTFKLIVSTEKVDDFLLDQKGLKLGQIETFQATRGERGERFGDDDIPRKKLVHENEWFTKDVHVKLVRQLDRVTAKDATLAHGKIKIKGHPSLKANISLSAAKSATRGVEADADIYRALERQGMEMLNFSSTRGDNMENILELTDIQNPEILKDHPLEVELDINLAEGEMILPLAFDGEFILLTGDPSRDDEGRTHISISDIPEIPDNRRSLGRALKLYFFKTYLKQDNVNQLCWIEYKPDGTFERHRNGVTEKVASAKNIVLAIHGIIGNTDSIVQGLRMAKSKDGKSVDQKFDLVLTYDYENLNTPISETAVKLKEQLAAAGLRESDDKRLTLLVHSMGGLVSRWFIEREGGNKVVDHLVMFGTPNVGSPFGMVDSARQLSSLLTTLAINTFPVFAPFGGALVYLLNRSAKLTPTLEQMNPKSEFIKTLNTSPDPGIPYTIVAGDIRDFRESSDQFGAKLIAKLGTGIVFDTLYQKSGHDIAVSDHSITGVAADRTPAPNKSTEICHHLNYFGSEAGLKAMAGVPW